MVRLLSLVFLVTGNICLLRAAPVCVSQPYANFLVAGFECEVNAAVFHDFTFSAMDSGPNVALDATQITVSPLQSGTSVGLRFAAAFDASGLPNGPGPAQGQAIEQYRFIYQVTRPDSLFTSATVTLNNPARFSPNPAKGSGVLSGKSISNDGATAITNDQDPDLTDTGVLFTPRATIFVDELLQLTGGASAAATASPVGAASLESTDNLFSYQLVIPEPSTCLLSLGGITLLLLVRRQK